MGTGDGRAVIRAAARQPTTLVIGLDAVADAMANASRRSARPAARGGVDNALFCVAGIEAPPPELIGRGDLVTVRFPWGSLLRGVLGIDRQARAGLASLVASSGSVDALVSVEDRDGLPDLLHTTDDRTRLAEAWRAEGFVVDDLRLAGEEEVAASGSTWARRLGAASAGRRRIVRFRLSRLP